MKRPISLTTDPIVELTWRIALPVSLGMLFQTMYHIVDTYCAGKLGTDALAALSVSFPVFFLLIAAASGLSQGTTAVISHALGAGDVAAARRFFAQSLVIACGVGLLLTIFGWLAGPAMFRLLGAQGNWLAQTANYMNVIFAGSVFFVGNVTINAGLAAQGETRPYRDVLILGFLANCALNPLFMWGFGFLPAMGVAGLALSTVLIQLASCVVLWSHVKNTKVAEHFQLRDLLPHAKTLREIATQSIPAALNMLTIAAGIFIMIWYMKHFGQAAVAAMGIATRIEQIVLMPAIGLGTAMLSIVGQNHGAGLPHRIREAWATNLKHGAGMMIIGGILVRIFGAPMMGIFTDDADVISCGKRYLDIAALTLAAYPILFVTVFMMQGLKRPAYGLWIGIYRQMFAPVVVYHLLAFTLGWGLLGVWWGMFLVTWSAALFALWWGWRVVAKQSGKSEALPK